MNVMVGVADLTAVVPGAAGIMTGLGRAVSRSLRGDAPD